MMAHGRSAYSGTAANTVISAQVIAASDRKSHVGRLRGYAGLYLTFPKNIFA